ncbi:MAG: SUMF1/EgtB/PvdO family nonheme iron enzyme, partial [Burkholderiales bacterium]|nr:SUMF1/EgtB/PvdO family nonheme iron enzyme [Burkholderiales bacterium]
MPAEEDLPDPLKELHLRQAFELTVRHWHNDVAQLVQTLKRVTAPSEDPGAVQEAARQKAEDEARRREAEARAAQDEAERRAAAEQARKEVEEERRRVEEEARRKAVEEEGRRTAAQETQRKAAAEVAHETVARATPPVGPQDWVGRNWKLLAVVGVVIGAIALLLLGRRPDTESVRAPGVTQAPPAAARAPSRATSVVAGETFRDCDQCPEMVVVPAGSFTMGSPRGEGSDDERPQHEVTIARAFAVGKYPITFDEWDACVAAGGCKYKPEDAGWGRSRRPAINVSWNDAQEYVAWLSKKTGKPYRLLSEAEWEYAARGGTTTRYPWG